MWLITKTWLNCFMHDLEEDYKIEKIKRLKNSLMSLLLSPLIIHYYYLFFVNEIFQFTFKYLNIKPVTKQV